MNRKGLAGLHGRTIRLRPLPRRFDKRLGWLPSIDDAWRLERTTVSKAPVRASNLATGHFIDLSADNVFEFREPDVVVLKSQLTLTARQVLAEPLPDPRARYSTSDPIVTRTAAKVQGVRPTPSRLTLEHLLLGVGVGILIANLQHRR